MITEANEDSGVNGKGSPIGVSTPIRQRENQAENRLPRETLRRFEGKSREVM